MLELGHETLLLLFQSLQLDVEYQQGPVKWKNRSTKSIIIIIIYPVKWQLSYKLDTEELMRGMNQCRSKNL